MLFTSIITVLALAARPALAIPPPIFGFPDSDNHTELGVTFSFNGNSTVVQEAMLFGSNITQTQPQLSLNPAMYQSVANYNGQYTIIMVDPDASTPEDPSRRFILHWMAPNVTQSQGANGQRQLNPPSTSNAAGGVPDFVSYQPPTPGNTSSAHRYIIYAFQQPASFVIPSAFAALAGGQNRANFNLTSFMGAAGLQRPAAAEYFYVNRQSQVPGDFVALSGATYPGGNGGAIFENSPNAAGNGTTTGGTTTTTTGAGTGTGSTATPTGSAAGSQGSSAAAPGWRVWGLAEGAMGAAIWGVAALL